MTQRTASVNETANAWLAGDYTPLTSGDEAALVLDILAARIRGVGDLPDMLIKVDIQVCDQRAGDAAQRAAVDRIAEAVLGMVPVQEIHYEAAPKGNHSTGFRVVTTARPPLPDQRTALLAQMAELEEKLRTLPAEAPKPAQDNPDLDHRIVPAEPELAEAWNWAASHNTGDHSRCTPGDCPFREIEAAGKATDGCVPVINGDAFQIGGRDACGVHAAKDALTAVVLHNANLAKRAEAQTEARP